MEKIRTGQIGVGYWGPNLARNLVESDQAEFVAVADLDQNKLDKLMARFPGIVTTINYQDLFDMDLDAIVVSTPPATHYKIVRDCLENGLHVMVEKPFVLDSNDGKKLIQIARHRNRVLMVGHTFEYNPAVRAMKEIIDSGTLGEIYYIDAVRGNLGLFNPNINAMWDLAPHDISIILYLLGQTPTSVSAEGGAFVLKDKNVHDVVYMHLNFENGIRANIRLSWLDPSKTRKITVVGSKRMLVYDDVDPVEKIKIYDKGVNFTQSSHNHSDTECSYYQGDIIVPSIESYEPLRMEIEHFLGCIQNVHIPQSDGDSGLRVVQVLEAAEKSLQGGMGGHVSLVTDQFEYLGALTTFTNSNHRILKSIAGD